MHLILLPGLDGTGRLFAPLLEALPAHFKATVVTYLPNHRQSIAELTEQVRTLLPTDDPYVIVAESFSGPIAVRLAATVPLNLKGLVLCASFVYVPVNAWMKAVLIFASRFLFLFPTPRAAVRYFLAGDDAPDALLTMCREALSGVSPSVLSHRLRMALAVDERQALRGIVVPVLFLLPTRDRLMNRDWVSQMHKIRKDMAVAPIDAPHLLLQREPIEAVKEMARWAEALKARTVSVIANALRLRHQPKTQPRMNTNEH